MLVELRQESSCYYSSPQYQASFWGQFVYIYEGRGILHVNSQGLRLVQKFQTLNIPFKDIKSVGLRPFSRWSKPAGLTYLVIKYATEWDEASEIHLIPFTSPLSPTWTTSLIAKSWYETLRDQEELQGRIEPPQLDPAPVSFWKGLAFTAVCFVIPCALGLLFLLLFIRLLSPVG